MSNKDKKKPKKDCRSELHQELFSINIKIKEISGKITNILMNCHKNEDVFNEFSKVTDDIIKVANNFDDNYKTFEDIQSLLFDEMYPQYKKLK